MTFNLVYRPYGERSILIEWPSVIDEDTLFNVLSFKDKILKENIELIVEINHAYNSLLIVYKNDSNFSTICVLPQKKGTR